MSFFFLICVYFSRVGCSVSVRDFKSSWRSGEAFLAILCSLRPQLVDLSLVRSRTNQENLEEAFHLAERELNIPRLLEPEGEAHSVGLGLMTYTVLIIFKGVCEPFCVFTWTSDVDVKDPEEKSIMTYVAQFLQYSNDMPSPDDHLQVRHKTLTAELTSSTTSFLESFSPCCFSFLFEPTISCMKLTFSYLTISPLVVWCSCFLWSSPLFFHLRTCLLTSPQLLLSHQYVR